MYLFSNILGVFVFDEEFNLADKIHFNSVEDYRNKNKFIDEIKNRHENLKEPDEETLKSILHYFKNTGFSGDFYNKNLQLTKCDVRNSVGSDTLLIHAVKSHGELDKAINPLAKRLREWYELYNPEFSRAMKEHENFVEEVLNKEKSELLKGLNISPSDSFGADLGQEDLEPVRGLAHQIYSLHQLRKSLEDYIAGLMDMLCPNTKAVCGAMTGARLVEHAGSLKRLSEMPASTIQVLGAENALFRHIKTGAKPPRHGIIVHHPLIAKATDRMHGRIARALADKISIASKIDYFQGKFIGDRLRAGLEEKFGQHDKTVKNI